jgi:hypothetical protein
MRMSHQWVTLHQLQYQCALSNKFTAMPGHTWLWGEHHPVPSGSERRCYQLKRYKRSCQLLQCSRPHLHLFTPPRPRNPLPPPPTPLTLCIRQ